MQYSIRNYTLIWQTLPQSLALFITACMAIHSDFNGEKAKSAMLWAASGLICFSAFGPAAVKGAEMLPLLSQDQQDDRAKRATVLGVLLVIAPTGVLLMRNEPILSSIMWCAVLSVTVAFSHAYHDWLLATSHRFGSATAVT